MSLRRRVVVGFLVVAAALVAVNLLLSTTFYTYLRDRLDKQLVTAAPPLSRRAVVLAPPPAPTSQSGQGNGGSPLTELYIAQAKLDGTSLMRVGSAIDTQRVDPAPSRSQLEAHATAYGAPLVPFTVASADGSTSWRMVVIHERSGQQLVVVGINMDETVATLWRMRLILLAGSLVVLGTMAAACWWMLRLGVRPLAAMVETADAIADGDLSRRVEHTSERTEAGRLGAALNTMMGEIEDAFRQREASEQRVRQFAADASHELRTPLTSIQGYAELWQQGGLRSEAELAEAMRRTEAEARRMARLVDDLLTLARLDQHRPMERHPVRLDVLAEEAVADARAVEPTRSFSLKADPVVLFGDEMQLRQLVGNLLTNARVHTPTDATVEVTVRLRQGVAVVEVADTGPGMPVEVADQVFQRFYRADGSRTRKRATGGSGLGLAIVAGIAEAHGGSARVETEVGSGTKFVIELADASAVPVRVS